MTFQKDFQRTSRCRVQQHDHVYTVYNEAISIVAKQQAKEEWVSDADYNKDDVRNRYVEQAKVKMQNQGLVVKSTIDKNIYDAMQLGVAEYGQYLDDGSGATVEPGTVMMDNSTGRIYGLSAVVITIQTKIITLLTLHDKQALQSSPYWFTVLRSTKDY